MMRRHAHAAPVFREKQRVKVKQQAGVIKALFGAGHGIKARAMVEFDHLDRSEPGKWRIVLLDDLEAA